jgi:hypothetical protein
MPLILTIFVIVNGTAYDMSRVRSIVKEENKCTIIYYMKHDKILFLDFGWSKYSKIECSDKTMEYIIKFDRPWEEDNIFRYKTKKERDDEYNRIIKETNSK